MGKVLQFDLQKRKIGTTRMQGAQEAARSAANAPGSWGDGLREAAALIPLAANRDGSDTPTFVAFLRQVKGQEVALAGETLSFLLGITQEEGMRSARTFAERLARNESLATKAEHLYDYVRAHKANDCLMILALCFDLHGARAIGVLQHLKAQAS